MRRGNFIGILVEMAEREGFEPSVEVSPHTRLAGERLQPTRPSLRGNLTRKYKIYIFDSLVKGALFINPSIHNRRKFCKLLAEGVGFEPTGLSSNGFQDRRLRPLGHPSGKYLSLA